MSVNTIVNRYINFQLGERGPYFNNFHIRTLYSKEEVNNLIEELEKDIQTLRREADATFN